MNKPPYIRYNLPLQTALNLALLLVLLLTFTGCNRASPLADTEWKLVTMNGAAPIEQRKITLKFFAEKFQGSAGCNGYSGEYQTTGSELNFPQMMITEMGCEPQEVMDQEQVYLQTLRSVTTYRLAQEQLELLDRAGNILLTYTLVPPTPEAALEGTAWELMSFVDGQIARAYADAPKITLRLENNQAQGSGGCNNFSASYKLSGSSLQFENISQTKMSCPEKNAMQQENEFFELLSSITTFEIKKDRLFLRSADGRGIDFRVQP